MMIQLMEINQEQLKLMDVSLFEIEITAQLTFRTAEYILTFNSNGCIDGTYQANVLRFKTWFDASASKFVDENVKYIVKFWEAKKQRELFSMRANRVTSIIEADMKSSNVKNVWNNIYTAILYTLAHVHVQTSNQSRKLRIVFLVENKLNIEQNLPPIDTKIKNAMVDISNFIGVSMSGHHVLLITSSNQLEEVAKRLEVAKRMFINMIIYLFDSKLKITVYFPCENRKKIYTCNSLREAVFIGKLHIEMGLQSLHRVDLMKTELSNASLALKALVD